MNQLIRSVILETKILLSKNIPTNLIEKIILETYKDNKVYILQETSQLSGDEGTGGHTVILDVSLYKQKNIEFVEKHFLFKGDPEIIEYEDSNGEIDYAPDPNFTNENKDIFINSLIEKNQVSYKWQWGYNTLEIVEINLT